MKNGEEVINGIVQRLKDTGIPPNDSAICRLLRSLDKYEMSQLTTFGDIDKWVRETRNSHE